VWKTTSLSLSTFRILAKSRRDLAWDGRSERTGAVMGINYKKKVI
jgi:hypothetical protein